jgi:hypothetical protein
MYYPLHSLIPFWLLLLNRLQLPSQETPSILIQPESYITTDGQSASLSWNKAPTWDWRPDFYYCQTVAGLLMCGALSDKRTGLSFTIAAGPRQRSHFRVQVPWDSWSYLTVSDSRFPFLSPPTTRRATVEVFDPASTRENSAVLGSSLYSLGSHPNENVVSIVIVQQYPIVA